MHCCRTGQSNSLMQRGSAFQMGGASLSLAQSKATTTRGYIPTLVSNSLIWIGRRGRLLMPWEHLAFQGIILEDTAAADAAVSASTLRSLAGNAFCCPCVLVASLAVLIVQGHAGVCEKRRCEEASLYWRHPVGEDGGSDDEDFEWGRTPAVASSLRRMCSWKKRRKK